MLYILTENVCSVVRVIQIIIKIHTWKKLRDTLTGELPGWTTYQMDLQVMSK